MPLVQISLIEGKSAKYIRAIADGVHAALCKIWAIPENDRNEKGNWSFGNGKAQLIS